MVLTSHQTDIDRSGGYAAVSSWLSQDADHETLIFRRFDWLAAHDILHMQSELIELENQLKNLYKAARTNMDLAQSCRRYTSESSTPVTGKENERLELIEKTRGKLEMYQNALLRQSQIATLRRPRSIVLDLFRKWLNGDEKKMYPFPIPGGSLGGKPDPVLEGGAQYMLDEAQDLVSLHSSPEQDLLTRFLTDNWLGGERYQRGDTKHFEQHKVQLTVEIISILLSATLLVGSIVSLYFVTSPKARLGMISGFALLFALNVGLFTNARRGEMYAATAAYAAVLVVFVSGSLGDNRRS